ncbi:MAG: hypothetical protein QOH61_1053 [Chloroflexota bacterium]|jgi:hypothetical protein|nr:hypothetical protein [Chloroflexota bacterium]
MSRALRSLLLAATVLAAGLVPSAAAAGSDDHRGWIWHSLTVIHCDEPTCDGTGVLPPWMETLRNPFDAVSDGDKNFYHQARIIAYGRPGHPHRCDETLFDRPFSGRCVVKDFGVGYIAAGAALEGRRDFWVSSETAMFGDGPLMDDPFAPYPIDTYQIAYPGHYTTKQLLGSRPEGVRLTEFVTRRHR